MAFLYCIIILCVIYYLKGMVKNMTVRRYISTLIYTIFTLLFLCFVVLGRSSIFLFILLNLMLIAYYIVANSINIKSGIVCSALSILFYVLRIIIISPFIFELISKAILYMLPADMSLNLIELFGSIVVYVSYAFLVVSQILTFIASINAVSVLPASYKITRFFTAFTVILFIFVIVDSMMILFNLLPIYKNYYVQGLVEILHLFYSLSTMLFVFVYNIMITITVLVQEKKFKKLYALAYPLIYCTFEIFVFPVFVIMLIMQLFNY